MIAMFPLPSHQPLLETPKCVGSNIDRLQHPLPISVPTYVILVSKSINRTGCIYGGNDAERNGNRQFAIGEADSEGERR